MSEEECKRRLADETLPTFVRCARYVYVPCGKCEACLTNRKNAWSFRLSQELKNSESGYFITLTYDDDNIPLESKIVDGEMVVVASVNKRDVQLFLKRLRKKIEPYKVRYFLVSEYGPQTFRPHYHMILFNFPQLLKNKLYDIINESWKLGFIAVDDISPGRIAYCCSYCLDSSRLPKQYTRNFMLCSKRPALGSTYLDNDSVCRYHVDNLDDFVYISEAGKVSKIKMPRYYRDKLFSDDEKYQLCNSHSEFHIRERVSLFNRQKRWLRRRGIEPSRLALNTPYDGSPLKAEMDKQGDFKKKVQQKCKMKKNG